MGQEAIRGEFLNTLDHIDDVFGKLKGATGPRSTLHQPDLHKLGEGLLLSGWTHWEEFLKRLLVEDLATDASGVLRHEARSFRTKNAPWRMAERMLNHPDHPSKFVEWSVYADVERRAAEFLGPTKRFSGHPLPWKSELEYIKRIRNGIAHKSDRA